MSIRMLEILREITRAQLGALRSRNFQTLNLLQDSRQDLMLRAERNTHETESESSPRIQQLLGDIFENETLMRSEYPQISSEGFDPAWI